MTGEKYITVPNLSSWLITIWGLVVLNPFSDLFPKNPALFGSMTALVPSEVFWGMLWTTWGGLGLIAAFLNRPQWTAFLVFTSSVTLASLYYVADYSQPGCWFFWSIGLANLFTWGAKRWSQTQ